MKIKDVVIIGGGPAGLTAGLYAARAALNTLIIERGMVGGQAASTERIENYPGFPDGIDGTELSMKMAEQAQRFDCEITYSNVDKLEKINDGFKVIYGNDTVITKTLIVATGAKPRLLNIKGEKEFHGRGVSYCATCDGAFFRDATLAVIGGGDAAVEEAMFLTKFAKKVFVIHRREELRATKILQKRAFANSKLEFIWNSVPEEIKGNQKVTGLLLKNIKNNTLSELPVDGIFVYIGTDANTDILSDLVQTTDKGFVITQENTSTTVPGLFVAGDLRNKSLRQVVTAASDGALAATQAEKFLAEKITSSSI